MCKRVRPTAVSFLSTRLQHPTEQDWHKLDRVLKYLNQSKDICLTLRCNEPMLYLGMLMHHTVLILMRKVIVKELSVRDLVSKSWYPDHQRELN